MRVMHGIPLMGPITSDLINLAVSVMRFKCVTHVIPFMRPTNVRPTYFALRVLHVAKVILGLRLTNLPLIEVMQTVIKTIRFLTATPLLSMIFFQNLMHLV